MTKKTIQKKKDGNNDDNENNVTERIVNSNSTSNTYDINGAMGHSPTLEQQLNAMNTTMAQQLYAMNTTMAQQLYAMNTTMAAMSTTIAQQGLAIQTLGQQLASLDATVSKQSHLSTIERDLLKMKESIQQQLHVMNGNTTYQIHSTTSMINAHVAQQFCVVHDKLTIMDQKTTALMEYIGFMFYDARMTNGTVATRQERFMSYNTPFVPSTNEGDITTTNGNTSENITTDDNTSDNDAPCIYLDDNESQDTTSEDNSPHDSSQHISTVYTTIGDITVRTDHSTIGTQDITMNRSNTDTSRTFEKMKENIENNINISSATTAVYTNKTTMSRVSVPTPSTTIVDASTSRNCGSVFGDLGAAPTNTTTTVTTAILGVKTSATGKGTKAENMKKKDKKYSETFDTLMTSSVSSGLNKQRRIIKSAAAAVSASASLSSPSNTTDVDTTTTIDTCNSTAPNTGSGSLTTSYIIGADNMSLQQFAEVFSQDVVDTMSTVVDGTGPLVESTALTMSTPLLNDDENTPFLLGSCGSGDFLLQTTPDFYRGAYKGLFEIFESIDEADRLASMKSPDPEMRVFTTTAVDTPNAPIGPSGEAATNPDENVDLVETMSTVVDGTGALVESTAPSMSTPFLNDDENTALSWGIYGSDNFLLQTPPDCYRGAYKDSFDTFDSIDEANRLANMGSPEAEMRIFTTTAVDAPHAPFGPSGGEAATNPDKNVNLDEVQTEETDADTTMGDDCAKRNFSIKDITTDPTPNTTDFGNFVARTNDPFTEQMNYISSNHDDDDAVHVDENI